jgi:3-deoxy-D-manno-octulosonic-acid transferase
LGNRVQGCIISNSVSVIAAHSLRGKLPSPMLTLYRLLALLISPFALWRLTRPATGKQGMQGRWRERLGRLEPAGQRPVWIHAASVGEVNAVQELINALIRQYPTRNIVVSTFTVSGAERVRSLFGQEVEHRFAPLDTWTAVRRWLARMNPVAGLITETEIWPELYRQARRRGLPLFLINARLTDRSLRRATRMGALFRQALESINLALCQSDDDAERFIALGLPKERCQVTGNLKFDLQLPADIGSRARELRQQWGMRPSWVAGSTRNGEDEIVLAAHLRLIREHPGALLVLAPRHPERCDAIRTLIAQAGLGCQVIGEEIATGTAVVLVDRLGQLLPCFAAAPVAFVGGSLVDIGGHNLLEPASFGKAVISGPHLYQQAEMAAALDQAGALLKVSNDRELADEIARLWRDPEAALELGRAALRVVEAGRGSLRNTLRLLRPELEKAIAAAD